MLFKQSKNSMQKRSFQMKVKSDFITSNKQKFQFTSIGGRLLAPSPLICWPLSQSLTSFSNTLKTNALIQQEWVRYEKCSAISLEWKTLLMCTSFEPLNIWLRVAIPCHKQRIIFVCCNVVLYFFLCLFHRLSKSEAIYMGTTSSPLLMFVWGDATLLQRVGDPTFFFKKNDGPQSQSFILSQVLKTR